jgi:hypothetical protein
MISYPPKCSPAWSAAERLSLIEWHANITLTRIREDDPGMPVVAKKPIHDLLTWTKRLATMPTERLESYRAELEKPYDDTRNYHSRLVDFVDGSFYTQEPD